VNIKDAMSCFTTGVTVVTAHAQGQDWGMTCNSFNTVSLDPSMVLWSVRKTSASHKAFVTAGGYMVNVLGAQQKDMAFNFAQGAQAERLADPKLVRGVNQHPRLADVMAWFDCSITQGVSAGDHDILIGEVLDFGVQAGHGLAYAQRSFGVFAPFED
jgi:3-hydroxy-9,10-secoandrosta-1,3,5(10)-triene-9,17-dione monooxygenase reductase component